MDITTQLELCLYEQAQIVTDAAYRLGSKLDSYLLVSFLFIVISIPHFLIINFYFYCTIRPHLSALRFES